jgi:tRNA modification GTPase
MGVEKAIRIASDADLIIYVLDSSTELDANDKDIFEMIADKKAILLLNKSDLEQRITMEEISKMTTHPVINVSVKENTGLSGLESKIKDMFFGGELSFREDIYITNERHREALVSSMESLNLVKQSLTDGMPEDFYSIDLMNAYEALGKIIGENVEEDLVNMIFKEFCMGK